MEYDKRGKEMIMKYRFSREPIGRTGVIKVAVGDIALAAINAMEDGWEESHDWK